MRIGDLEVGLIPLSGLDAFSRRVVGYAIDDHLRAELALQALQQAIKARRPEAGLVQQSSVCGPSKT